MIAATLALFFASALLLTRGANRADESGVSTTLAAMAVQLVLAARLAIGLLVGHVDHPVTLVLTLGAVYFIAALVEGVRGLQNRGSQKCLVR